MKLIMLKQKPKRVEKKVLKGSLKQTFFKIVHHPQFEPFIMGCIVLNTLLLMFKWHEEPEGVTWVREFGNLILGAVFVIEAIIKIGAFGTKYFKDGWNLFDFIVVAGSLSGFVLSLLTTINIGFATTMVRSFRIFRIVRLVKRAKVLRLMFSTMVYTLPAMSNIGALLILKIYIFAILGMNLFADVKFSGALNAYANF